MTAVLRLIEHNMKIYLTPPNATDLYQALDKLFQDYHTAYKKQKARLLVRRKMHHLYSSMTRELACEAIAHVILARLASSPPGDKSASPRLAWTSGK